MRSETPTKFQARLTGVVTPTIGTFQAKDRPLAVARPMRRPVKEPGPTATATPSIWLFLTDALSSMSAIWGMSCSEWVSRAWMVSSARSVSSWSKATLDTRLDVSMAKSIFFYLIFYSLPTAAVEVKMEQAVRGTSLFDGDDSRIVRQAVREFFLPFDDGHAAFEIVVESQIV